MSFPNRYQKRGNPWKQGRREMGMKAWLMEAVPIAAMVVVECLDVGLTTLSKAAMSRGMNHFVFVVYSNALASLILFTFCFLFLRKDRPPLNFSLICKFFLLSLAGITVTQNCVFTGVSYSSPTLGSAMSNLIPAFTFLLAVAFRLEKLDLRSSRSLIKIMGTLVSISGALIVTLYKGPPIFAGIRESPPISSEDHLQGTGQNWIIGALFFTIAGFSLSVWNTFQAPVLKRYPSEVTVVSFYTLFGAIQCAVVALIAVRDLNAWKLRPDVELVTIIYSAICGSVVTFSIQTWCIKIKGPVFVSMFKPLSIGIAAFMGVIFLGNAVYTGSVLGAIIIVTGFYGVMWAQSKEGRNGEGPAGGVLPSISENTPMLQREVD